MLWDQSIELLRAVIFSAAHACNGNLAFGVILVSLGLRLALLPFTLRLARRAMRHQQRLAALRPELEVLQQRYANDPAALWRETAALRRRHGIRTIDPAGLLGGLVQAPVFAALFAALRQGMGSNVRFLWIGNLSLPDVTVALCASALAVAGLALAPPANPEQPMSVVPLVVVAGMTCWFLSSTSAIFALSSAAGATVNLLQSVLLGRAVRGQRA